VSRLATVRMARMISVECFKTAGCVACVVAAASCPCSASARHDLHVILIADESLEAFAHQTAIVRDQPTDHCPRGDPVVARRQGVHRPT
jgi:hypothetical protein